MVAGSAAAAKIENVIGGNSASNELLALNFDQLIATALNTDANTRASLRSFDFFDDTCNKRLDVVVADTNRGDLLLYVNGKGNSSYICQGGNGTTCPSRPDGISLSDKRVMAVADTGTAGGTPAVWLFSPEANATSTSCPSAGDDFGPFSAPRSTGRLSVCSGGNCAPVGGISDTEFVRVPGGGFNAGDLLVVTTNPTTLSRLTKAQVEALRTAPSSASGTNAQVLVSASGFAGENPVALAFVPNTAGVGTNDALSESEDLLVAGTNGRIIKIRFRSSGGTPVVSSYNGNFLGVSLGNGPLGVAAGIVEKQLFMVVADRQRGSFLKVPLQPGTATPEVQPPVCADSTCSNWPVIKDGVQNPQGVAINTKAVAAEDCDNNNQDQNQIGCNIRNTLDLLYSQDIVSCDDEPNNPNCVNDTILAGIQVVDDPRNGNLRDISFSQLGLEGNYVVPASCKGLQLSDDGRYVLVVVDINKQFRVEPGEVVLATEQAEKLLPQLAACSVIGTRIYHRPTFSDYPYQPEGNALHDITIDCQNPSRSLGRDNSPLVFCADANYDASRNGAPKGGDAKRLQSEAFARLGYLRDAINAMDDNAINGLKPALQTYVSNAEGYIKKKKFTEASAEMDLGAIYVHQNLSSFQAVTKSTPPAPPDPDETAYGDLLGRFLSTALFLYETVGGPGNDYCVPGDIPIEGLACQ